MTRRTPVGSRSAIARSLLTILTVLLLLLATQSTLPLAHSIALADSAIHYVAPGGVCSGVTPCYATVQAAVDAASAGDVIKIAAGTYSDVHERQGDNQVVHITKDVNLRGGYSVAGGFSDPPRPDTNRTILNALEQGRVVVIDRAGPVLEGLVITGGAGYFSGGGINCKGGAARIANCEIVDNSATGDGGGVFISGGSLSVLGCDISDNRAYWAGGVRIINNANVSLIGNRITGNSALASGGGIEVACCGGSTPVIARNLIHDNQGGEWGGGVRVEGTNALLVNNIITSNEADEGAGVWLGGSPGYPASVAMTHNTMAGASTGDGIWAGDSVTATLVNNIITGFTTGISNTAPSGSTVDAQTTLFYGNSVDHSSGVGSSGEVWGAPVFLNPGADDYHIGPSSAAIDQGQDAGIGEDFEGRHRPIGTAPDIGADEYRRSAYLPLSLNGG